MHAHLHTPVAAADETPNEIAVEAAIAGSQNEVSPYKKKRNHHVLLVA